jgi:type I restriction enzyme S subunit
LSAAVEVERSIGGFYVAAGFLFNRQKLNSYLRLPLVCALMDLFSSASMYPAISERDLLRMPIPVIDEKVQERITAEVEAVCLAKPYGTTLVRAASDAVAPEIEHGEKAARQSLNAVMRKFYADSKNPDFTGAG